MQDRSTYAPATEVIVLVFFLTVRRPRSSTLFPYTTLFRSRRIAGWGRTYGDAEPGELLVYAGSVGFLEVAVDRKSTRLNSSHANISYAVFCLKKKMLHVIYGRRAVPSYWQTATASLWSARA